MLSLFFLSAGLLALWTDAHTQTVDAKPQASLKFLETCLECHMWAVAYSDLTVLTWLKSWPKSLQAAAHMWLLGKANAKITQFVPIITI